MNWVQVNRPSSTITAAGIGGSIATIVMGLTGAVFPEFADRLPPGIEAAIATLAGFVVGYKVRERVLREKFLEEQLEDLS